MKKAILMYDGLMGKYSIRQTKTASGATAVQVVRYFNRSIKIVKHIGSAHNKEELEVIIQAAEKFVMDCSSQLSLFPQNRTKLIHIDHALCKGITHNFARDFLLACAKKCGLSLKPLFLDLAIMRIIESSSKRRALDLLKRYFDIRYSDRMYRTFKYLTNDKKSIEQAAISCTQKILKDDLFFVLYDVTTLYFETHRDDEFRKSGFSKDDKSKQPQIVVGLLVTRSGFPLAHNVFHGKTFEGHTMLPLLKIFVRNYSISMPVVVADAAMLSEENITLLKAENISYIVGARLGNKSYDVIRDINTKLGGKDGSVIRIPSKHGDLVCSFSEKRYRKHKHDMEKQVEKAKYFVIKNEAGKRVKFVKKIKDKAVTFDEKLKYKTELLLGIRGYCTNIPEKNLSNDVVISYYHDLWHVEQSFRMTKSDLEARPIFHRKEEAIRAHVLLCFVSLMISKYLEIITNLSLKRIRDLIWDVSEVHIEDKLTGEIFILRTPTKNVMQSPLASLVKKWKIPY
jgi:transposase